MIVKNTEVTRSIKRVAATMAVEDMYLDEDFIKEMIKVGEGKKTSEEVRQEIIKKYTQNKDDSFPER